MYLKCIKQHTLQYFSRILVKNLQSIVPNWSVVAKTEVLRDNSEELNWKIGTALKYKNKNSF
jgi:hypothetical protein